MRVQVWRRVDWVQMMRGWEGEGEGEGGRRERVPIRMRRRTEEGLLGADLDLDPEGRRV